MNNLVGSGADCGPVNPLMGLAKRFNDDRSSQLDRFGSQNQSRPGLSGLRQQQRADAFDQNLAEEFFRQSAQGPLPQDLRQDFFKFGDMSNELERLAAPGAPLQHFGPPMPAMDPAMSAGPQLHRPMEDWSADFLRQEPAGPLLGSQVPEFAEFDRIFEAQRAQAQGTANWADDFARFVEQPQGARLAEIPPEQEAEFESAFERAKEMTNTWEQEFIQQEADRWVEEFSQQEAARVDTDDARDTLAQTAGMLLEVVRDSTNPKFKQSKFMDFMRQLRDREVAIEGNKVVEQKQPVGGSDWASEFAQKPAGSDWAGEFATANPRTAHDWAREFEQNGAMRDAETWEAQFERQQGDVHNEGGWTQEFQRVTDEKGKGKAVEDPQPDTADFEKAYDQAFSENDWIKDFRHNIAQIQAENAELDAWDELQEDFDKFEPQPYGYRLKNPEYVTYTFQHPNPFSEHPTEFLNDISQHRSLAESILALEAAVQRDPHNGDAWFNLGQRQQENEREGAAIASLRQAVAINPGNLDAWLALAVSYTNENSREDVQDALEAWIENHPRYGGILARRRAEGPVPTSGPDRHAFVTGLLLDAVRSNPGDFDADVQVALGVLFNGSGEYDKAVDCFEAALAKRPHDYMLYNKLGATLANANEAGKAIDAYFHALQINPGYVRARYNIAIACIGMGQQKEAAEHLLTALSQQSHGVSGLAGKSPEVDATLRSSSLVSDGVWETLRMTMIMMNRTDLASAVEKRDLNAFRGEFAF
ncbi:TPR-like protein [Gonapodya prolifera JEL478]|uniref:TPR-like protein n=1 Tax=Gonapodya prolifera (strain JEL478) TaxID=1344416 RepID=A0A139A5J9_GONPJ|nr:TPR-like protein [Gonapodya prolifera JEL478]|eukprot:KXS11909.1 TPR-like protein [Gonapodya prolifera JEL478]